jgi:osmotically-inducible protein OsmY
MLKSDSAIETMVENELEWDPVIDARNIAVQVKDSVAELAGFTKSYTDKYTAERIAKRVVGVKAVANDIEVKLPSGTERADPDVAHETIEALQRDLPFASEKLKAIVRNGWIILEGNVEWDHQRRSAESAIRKIKGVKGVTNSIEIKPQASPADVKLKIEQAFKRTAEVDAHKIRVEADGGLVTLRGRVRSWAEKEEAGRTAWRGAGVTDVRNRIEVDTSLQMAEELVAA